MNEKSYRLSDSKNVGKKFLVIGLACLFISAIGYFMNAEQFFHSYLTSFMFWLSISLGVFFLLMIHYLTGAVWSVVLRRLYENFTITLPYMFILFIPVILGIHELYHWSHQDVVASDALLQKKAAFLNSGFFSIRSFLYFAIWTFFAVKLYKESLNQDIQTEKTPLSKSRQICAVSILFFALTITFSSFDWIMSLDAHWYSTIFGVYIFSGCTMAALASITLLLVFLKRHPIFKNVITVEHFHDVGKLLFTFVVFWAYMAFSQYFLIWYANIPEETIWFKHRWVGSWKFASLLLVFGHFVVPFFILMIRGNKRKFTVMAVMSIWLLFMHWLDLYWLILPNLHHHGVHLSWMDLTSFVGIGGLFLWLFWIKLTAHSLLPVKDPFLEKSINIKNY